MKRHEKDKHECGEMTCYNCQQTYMINEEHLCYMRLAAFDLKPEKFYFL